VVGREPVSQELQQLGELAVQGLVLGIVVLPFEVIADHRCPPRSAVWQAIERSLDSRVCWRGGTCGLPGAFRGDRRHRGLADRPAVRRLLGSAAPGPAAGPTAIQQVRVAAALLAFTNAMAVSLFSLVPGTSPGYPAVVLGVIGILFTAAGVRSILSSQATRRQQRQQLGLVILLLLIFGTELACGVAVLADSRLSTAVQVMCYALIASVLVGIARAWELVGERDTGLWASLSVLTGRAQGPDDRPD